MSIASVTTSLSDGANAPAKSASQASPSLRSTEEVDANVPAEMKACPQWLCWKLEVRKGAKTKDAAPAKPTKVPYIAETDPKKVRRADPTDRSCFVTYEQAKAAYVAVADYAGIAFAFTPDDPFCGVDLDDCIDADAGEPKAWGRELIDLLDSYTEISPSGTGVKIFLQGKKPGERARRRHHDGEVEVYDKGRYFTVTGRRMMSGGSGAGGAELRQEQLQRLYDAVMEPKAAEPKTPERKELVDLVLPEGRREDVGNLTYDLTDEQIIVKASRAKNGAKFSDLFAGRWEAHFGSQSEADASVVFTLAFYTKDAGRIDQIFRQSKLLRPKWDERHGAKTYGQATIENALKHVTKQYRPHRPSQKSAVVLGGADGVERDENGLIGLGQRCPETERLVLSPTRTMPTAQAFVRENYTFEPNPAQVGDWGSRGRGGIPTLRCYAGVMFVWRGNRYVPIEDRAIRHELQPWLHDALRYRHNERTGVWKLVDYESNATTISAAQEAIRDHYYLDAELTPTCWLPAQYLPGGATADRPKQPQPDPRNLLAFPSGTLDLATQRVLPPTPALFNINAIEFDYDPKAEPCERWIKFMEQLFGDDLESMYLLQEWMGYCLVGDTSQQKMMLMVGPKRSGKGTIGRVLQALVGAGNVAGPTTTGLAGTFGLQQLIGKSLAIVSDARFAGDGVSVVIERLLCISGEDALSIDRKYLGAVTLRLPTRFMLLTNELPRLTDSSGALAGRFVILRLTRSFYGREDVNLTQSLTEELPGILLWAIEGLLRLRRQGHFTRPKSTADAMLEMEDLSSPVSAFVRDYCEVRAGVKVNVADLYAAWKRWCEQEGRSMVTSKQVFGRDLVAAVPSVNNRRNHETGRFYEGITLKPEVLAALSPF
jgi:P4 family phage/plasmid primase-like protien